MVNNLIFDPGQRIVHYNLMAEEWGDHPQTGQLAAVGNVARAGPSTVLHIAFTRSALWRLEYFGRDNSRSTRSAIPCRRSGATPPRRKIIMLARRRYGRGPDRCRPAPCSNMSCTMRGRPGTATDDVG